MAQKIKNGYINNSDILFIYDAKMCNPNGDPDDENKPRMDYETETNLVSDVRLKRYIRDYLEDKGNSIFVAKVEDKTVDATQRLGHWITELVLNDPKETNERKDKAQKIKAILDKPNDLKNKTDDMVELIDTENKLLKTFIDVRLFGATMPIKSQKKGQSFTFTGPVQFNWGHSLNKVCLVDSSTISSTFAGRTREGEEDQHGTFGKDYRVYYSLIAFHGIVSCKRAEHTQLSTGDINLLEEALIKAIPLQATRSKIDQYPRLLIRVEYIDGWSFIGDLRRYVKFETVNNIKDSQIRDISQIRLNLDKLREKLIANKQIIQNIHYWQDKELAPCFYDLITDNELIDKFKPFK